MAPSERGRTVDNPPVIEELGIRYQDLDPYGHVNNAVHFSFFEAARIAYWRALSEKMELGDLEAGDLPGATSCWSEGP